MQRKMISVACPIRRGTGEDSDVFARRKGRYASGLAREAGLWSEHWFKRALTWDDHLMRNHSGCSWNHSLVAFHDADWLKEQRSFFAASAPTRHNPWTSVAGRTGTRAAPGKVQARWQESVLKVRRGEL